MNEMEKIVDDLTLNKLADDVISMLIKNDCTISDFQRVADKVQSFYSKNATVRAVTLSTNTDNQNRSHH